jgi:transcriptional regulator with XRE-family HTH domain
MTNTDPEPQSIALSRLRLLCASGRARAIRAGAQLALADLARDIGVTPSAFARWESGETRPTGERALVYLRLLDALAGGKASPAAEGKAAGEGVAP